MAVTSNPCIKVFTRAPGAPVSCSASSSVRFNVDGYPFSSPVGELFDGDGGSFTLRISRRVVVPGRTLRLEKIEKSTVSTPRRWEGRLGGQSRKALLDETRSTAKDEKHYSDVALQEDEELLKQNGAQLVQQLEGTCIYLVGMMGSGKSTVGRGLSDALGYIFFDSDKLVEQAGGTTIGEMFRTGREEEFRNAETDVIEQLCSMSHLVVATGGGAVIRPQNWDSMRRGITCLLDVPVEVLARRVVAVGCHSRPLLSGHASLPSEDAAYNQALERLTHIHHERYNMYRRSDVVVSLEAIARKRDLDIETVTPTMIAIQVLEEISAKLQKDRRVS
ncbi:hypothetical protein R1flu_004187 [Riccia fluitans]|uniref:shikimate kinase n=1 Tax=Riccia fluitans TaxID=41844 RepID=A0ABD1YQ61_9MARC